eukprot:g3305.t1
MDSSLPVVRLSDITDPDDKERWLEFLAHNEVDFTKVNLEVPPQGLKADGTPNRIPLSGSEERGNVLNFDDILSSGKGSGRGGTRSAKGKSARKNQSSPLRVGMNVLAQTHKPSRTNPDMIISKFQPGKIIGIETLQRKEYYDIQLDSNSQNVVRVGAENLLMTVERYFGTINIVHPSNVMPDTSTTLLNNAKLSNVLNDVSAVKAKKKLRNRNHDDLNKKVLNYGRRASRPPGEMERVILAMNESETFFDFSCYPRFSALISKPSRDRLRPRKMDIEAEPWLFKLVEGIYDARFRHDMQDLKEEANLVEDSNEGTMRRRENRMKAEDRMSNIFPVFIVDHLSKTFGLRTLVDRECWELMYHLHKLRKSNDELEFFARFLEEYYDPEDLLFYLFVRNIIERTLDISFAKRWSHQNRWEDAHNQRISGRIAPGEGLTGHPPSVFLSYAQAMQIARSVFGDASEDIQSEADLERSPMRGASSLFKDFVAKIRPHFTGRKYTKMATRGGMGGGGGGFYTQDTIIVDKRKIDAKTFLHIALVHYHKTRPAEGEAFIAEQERLAFEEEMKELEMENPGDINSGLKEAAVRHAGGVGEILVKSKEEQQALYREAEHDYQQTMKALVETQRDINASQLDGKVDERKIALKRLEAKFRSAIENRKALGYSVEFGPGGVLNEDELIEKWALEALPIVYQQEEKNKAAMNEEKLQKVVNNFISPNVTIDDGTLKTQLSRKDKNGEPGSLNAKDLSLLSTSIKKDREKLKKIEESVKKMDVMASNEAYPLVLNAIRQTLRKQEQKYVSFIVRASCESLNFPGKVLEAIQEEAMANLEGMVSTVIDSIVQNQNSPEIHASPLLWNGKGDKGQPAPPSIRQLEDALAYFFDWTTKNLATIRARNRSAGSILQDEIDVFCQALLQLPNVRNQFEPMVAMLASYAQERLKAN